VQQYFIWLGNMLTGDFGQSFALNRPVIDEVLERFNGTLVLAGTAFVICSVLGVMAGVVSAANQYGTADKAITFAVLLGISIPSFFLGMMMILLFAVNLRWFRSRACGRSMATGTSRADPAPDAARAGAVGGGHGRDRAAVALGHAGGAAAGLHPHRARQGRA
jgi:ABC-type dipeptide/oligopeptide/nickel transport system permease component